MPELVSVRFSKIGYRDARLDGLAYNLNGMDKGAPDNALVIGSNSSGKTSQLHLLFSLFLPHKHELAAQKDNSGRQFAYYFEENEIGFVATEWTIPGSGTLPGMVRKTRVIGRFTQFTNRDKYEHTTCFFSFIADEELGIDDLPITSSIPGRVPDYCRTISEAKKYLQETFDKPAREFCFVKDNMHEWQVYLMRIGFNIDQFRLMIQFTMSEGDSTSFLQKFKSKEMVLEFICRDVLDKNTTNRLHGMLSQYRESVRLEPITRAQITAYAALSDLFVTMEPASRAYSSALKYHETTLESLRLVVSRVTATLKAAESGLDSLKAEQFVDTEELRRYKSERENFEARLRGVKQQISVLECEATTATHEECVKKLDRAIRILKAVQALVGRGKVEHARFLSEDLARQLDALSEPVRSFSDDVAMARFLLSTYLSADEFQETENLKTLTEEVKAASSSKKELNDSLKERTSQHGKKLGEKAGLDKAEASRMLSLERLVTSSFLPDRDACPHAALSVLSTAIDQAEARRGTLEEEKNTLGTELAGLRERINSNAADLSRYQANLKAAEELLRMFSDETSCLAWLPGIRAVFEQSEPDLFFPDLASRLRTCYEKESAEIARIDAEIAKLNDQVAAIEGHGGLLPPARDVKLVIAALETAGVKAFTYWQVFSERNDFVEDAKRLVEAHPSRYGGVAVSSRRDLDKALEVLAEGCGVLAPVIISIYTVDDTDDAFDGLAILPDVALAIDRKRSAEFCENARIEAGKYQEALPVIRQSRDETLDAKEKLLAFLSRYDESSLSAMETKIVLIRGEMEACRIMGDELAQMKSRAEAASSTITSRIAAVVDEIASFKESHATIKTHIDSNELGRQERDQRLSELIAEISGLEDAIRTLTAQIALAEEHELSVREMERKAKTRRLEIAGELASLSGDKKTPTESFRTLVTSTVSARGLLREKERALESASADKEYIRVKERSDRAKNDYAELEKRWREEFGEIPEADIREAADYIGERSATESDSAQAQSAKEEAIVNKSLAGRERDDAVKRQRELKNDYARLKVVPFDGDIANCNEQETVLSIGVENLKKRADALDAAIHARTLEIQNYVGRVNLLSSLASQVEVECEVAEPFVTDTEAVGELKAARKAEADAVEKNHQLEEQLKRYSNELAKLLDDQLCASISPVVASIKEEMHRCGGVLREGITALAEHVQQAAAPLAHELDTMEHDKGLVVTEVMHDVKKALILLSRLEKKSMVPSLGGIWRDWTGRAFIRFRTSVNIDTEQSRLSVAGTVTRLAQAEGSLPVGSVIVQAALSELLGNAYTIESLKPDTSPSTRYFGIAHPEGLHSWSGGQKLSGSVLFYMAMCNLLAIEGQSGGILLMDNPFGSCNHIEFVRLIVALTRQYGVQMIAYTPTEDEQIRRLYPLNILMRKGGIGGINKRTGQMLVQQEKTVYNDGETAFLEIKREAPHAS